LELVKLANLKHMRLGMWNIIQQIIWSWVKNWTHLILEINSQTQSLVATLVTFFTSRVSIHSYGFGI